MSLDLERLHERVDEEAHPVLDWLLSALQDIRTEETSSSRRELVDLVSEIELDQAWDALRAVHGELDQQLEGGESPAVVRERRERLVRASRRMVTAYLRSDMRAQREMLRDISHDIRSPLNSILFLTDGLFSEQAGPLTSTQKRQLGIVYSAASSLLNFVNDILDFARMEEGEVEGVAEVPFSLRGTCSDVARLVEPLVEHRGTDFEVSLEIEEGTRRGDPQLLCRVLVNLLSNAIEAAGDGGTVRLRIAEDGDDPDWLEFRVADDCFGPDIERIREFLGPHSDRELTRMLQGQTHGLGLHICSRLIRAADGEIRVSERDDGGSRFVVRVPFPRG